MKSLTKDRILKILICAFLCCLVFVSSFSSYLFITKADTSVSSAFEEINVLDDLESSSDFSLSQYPANEDDGSISIINFVEFCYSSNTTKQGDYGLYLYLYNPSAKKINTKSPLNMVQMAVAYNEEGSPTVFEKFHLKFCSISTRTNYERVFYKFKVVDHISTVDGKNIFNRVNSDSRRYDISSVELLINNDVNATDYGTGGKYIFTGFAKGYGLDPNAEDSLACTVNKEMDRVSLDVHATYYRPKGVAGDDTSTQDTLHSVYFAVPNKYLNKYGSLYSVHATWLNAVLKPMLCIDDYEVYSALSEYIGKTDLTGLEYALTTKYNTGSCVFSNEQVLNIYEFDFAYNMLDSEYCHRKLVGSSLGIPQYFYCHDDHCSKVNGCVMDENQFIDLPALYFAQGPNDNYRTKDGKLYVPSSEILKFLNDSKEQFGGELVNGKYSKEVFSSVDENFTDVTIYATDTFPLRDIQLSPHWFLNLLGIPYYIDESFVTNGIQEIKYEDILSTGSTIMPKAEFCEKYYVSENDYVDIQEFCTKSQKDDSTVFLFRYMVSEYTAQKVTAFKDNGSDLWSSYKTDAFFFQETANLDFDIIDLTFEKDGDYKVIPVVANPIDIVHDGTRPVDPPGCNNSSLFSLILSVLFLLVLIWVLSKFGVLPYVTKAVVWIITAPFKFIKWIIQKAQASSKNKKKAMQNKANKSTPKTIKNTAKKYKKTNKGR